FIPPIVTYMKPSTGNITLEYDQLGIITRNQTITYVSDYTSVPGSYQYALTVTRTGNTGAINTSTGVANALVSFRVNGAYSLPAESKIVVQLPNYVKDINVSKLTDGV